MGPTGGWPQKRREVETLLAGLRAAPLQLSPERLMFVAGQRSARRKLRMWQSIAAVLLLSIGLSFDLRPPASERNVYVARQQPASGATSAVRTPPPDQHSYLRLRDHLLHGMNEGSPPPATSPAGTGRRCGPSA